MVIFYEGRVIGVGYSGTCSRMCTTISTGQYPNSSVKCAIPRFRAQWSECSVHDVFASICCTEFSVKSNFSTVHT